MMNTSDTMARVTFPPETASMFYIREAEVDGEPHWAVFNCDGEISFLGPNRSQAFFFVTDGVKHLVRRH